MLCGIPHSNPQHRRFLRSFRSHKALRHHDSDSQEEMPRVRRPSDDSSPARSSFESGSRRPSASNRSDVSVDWDPLRLHPPLAAGPAPPLRDSFAAELRHARSSNMLGQPRRPYQSSCSRTVIYDGFDFGFHNNPTPATAAAATSATMDNAERRRALSLTPSDASSECSLTFSGASSFSSSSDKEDEHVDEHEHEHMLGLSPAPPASRSGPRPRPRMVKDGTGLPGLGGDDNDADYFFRRGGWKRRGIVFVNAVAPLAGEEETFEI